MFDPTKLGDVIRRIVKAVGEARIEARHVVGMSDEQLEEYDARLQSEFDDAIAQGERQSEGPR